MNKTTMVLTFLNEGYSYVENTVKSIRNTHKDSVDILLYDDASTDGVNYNKIATDYNCNYFRAISRQGVAGGRMLALKAVTTKNAIILDAHMKFYSDRAFRISEALLDINPKMLINAASAGIDENWNDKGFAGAGCFLNLFEGYDNPYYMTVKWANNNALSEVSEIPIVLGAYYAFDVKYFLSIGGLAGLKSYGSDEELMSMKYWMTGGKCVVIKTESIGHLYKQKQNFTVPSADLFSNRLVPFEILPVPVEVKANCYKMMKGNIHEQTYKETLNAINNRRQELETLRTAIAPFIIKNAWAKFDDINTMFYKLKVNELKTTVPNCSEWEKIKDNFVK